LATVAVDTTYMTERGAVCTACYERALLAAP
jgi:hypothetical protein